MIDFVTSQVKPGWLLWAAPQSLSLTVFSPSDCLANSNSPSCGMNGLLHLLYVLAAILGVLLLGAVCVAIYIWRRNRSVEITRQ